jgi:hypothetical protein
MPHGGKRPGAGRKKGGIALHTLEAQGLRKRLIKAAEENWEAIVFTMIGTRGQEPESRRDVF